MTGDILRISRLRMGTDGRGVSTLVAFARCNLYCDYCINDRCHSTQDFIHDTPRALYTPKELVEVLRKDDIYYRMTGGGIVFGGGEPLLQAPYIHKVCRIAPKEWAKRIETSLNVPWDNIQTVIDDIDKWIIDIKDMNGIIYKAYTKAGKGQLDTNLLRLREQVTPDRIHIRIPRIPGYNTDKDVEYSVKCIRSMLGVEPEVFSYYIPEQTYNYDHKSCRLHQSDCFIANRNENYYE